MDNTSQQGLVYTHPRKCQHLYSAGRHRFCRSALMDSAHGSSAVEKGGAKLYEGQSFASWFSKKVDADKSCFQNALGSKVGG